MANDQKQSTPNQNNSIKTYQPADKLVEQPNNTIELSPRDIEARTEESRAEALELSKIDKKDKYTKKTLNKKTNYRRSSIGDKQRVESYTRTIKQVQNEMPPTNRILSRIIHEKTIERVSDLLGNTIARPNAMLSGAFFAFALTLLAYVTAKTIGYVLSGSETIAAFIFGWIIGIIYDYLRVLFTGRRN